jgi:EAL domain-containing protein (putative c-di-GMP-specific phosphodiesterase class I)
MVDIGRHMRLDAVAEGVEPDIQRDMLLEIGCKAFQGFLFSHTYGIRFSPVAD